MSDDELAEVLGTQLQAMIADDKGVLELAGYLKLLEAEAQARRSTKRPAP